MHAFPPNGAHVAVSNDGNGAGSNANAASEQGALTIQGSTGASHATPYTQICKTLYRVHNFFTDGISKKKTFL